MYQEEVADITATHLRSHIASYLDTIQSRYADSIKLQMPKSIETANLVGGVYNATPKEMPAYVVDVLNKQFSGESTEGLWLYNYTGHIAGVVSGGNEATVNKSVKRHSQAVEQFVRDHQFMHQMENQVVGNSFSFAELVFLSAAWSGAEMVDEENNRQTWIAGFRIDVLWVISEEGPQQHA
jgi:hypothetical protein